MATKFRYPAGARPLLVEETARRRAVERRLVSLLEQRGFAEIVLPVIDFAEPYETLASRDATRRSYRRPRWLRVPNPWVTPLSCPRGGSPRESWGWK